MSIAISMPDASRPVRSRERSAVSVAGLRRRSLVGEGRARRLVAVACCCAPPHRTAGLATDT